MTAADKAATSTARHNQAQGKPGRRLITLKETDLYTVKRLRRYCAKRADWPRTHVNDAFTYIYVGKDPRDRGVAVAAQHNALVAVVLNEAPREPFLLDPVALTDALGDFRLAYRSGLHVMSPDSSGTGTCLAANVPGRVQSWRGRNRDVPVSDFPALDGMRSEMEKRTLERYVVNTSLLDAQMRTVMASRSADGLGPEGQAFRAGGGLHVINRQLSVTWWDPHTNDFLSTEPIPAYGRGQGQDRHVGVDLIRLESHLSLLTGAPAHIHMPDKETDAFRITAPDNRIDIYELPPARHQDLAVRFANARVRTKPVQQGVELSR